MNVDRGLEVLVKLAEQQRVQVAPHLAKVPHGTSPSLGNEAPRGFSVYVGVGQQWDNSSVFLAKVARDTGCQEPTSGLVQHRHFLKPKQVPSYIKTTRRNVEEEIVKLQDQVPMLAEREICAAVYASWKPEDSRYSFISQAFLSDVGIDVFVWFDDGNSNGWDFNPKQHANLTHGHLTASSGLETGGDMSDVPLNKILEACCTTASFVAEQSEVTNVVMEGKVMFERNRVMLIDVYEGPSNSQRQPMTHQTHLRLSRLPPRGQWRGP